MLQNCPYAQLRLLQGQRTNEAFVLKVNGVRHRIEVTNFYGSLVVRPAWQVPWWAFLEAWGEMNEMTMKVRQWLMLAWIGIPMSTAFGANYYIDYVGGSDSNSGTATNSAWQHCPGDKNATGKPRARAGLGFAPGDKVLFKGGVAYRGTVQFNFAGAAANALTIAGDGWGSPNAIISGAELISTPWTQCTNAADAHGSPNWSNYWWTPCPTNMSYCTTLSQGTNRQFYFAQDPNPTSWFFNQQLTDGSFRTCSWNNRSDNQFVWCGINSGSWTHVAVTKSGSNVMFYVNGQQLPGSALNTTFQFDNNAAIGAQGYSMKNAFSGCIDELAVFSRPLSKSEIVSIYAAGKSGMQVSGQNNGNAAAPPSGMVGWWKFDGNYVDQVSGDSGTPVGNVSFVKGEVRQALCVSNDAANANRVGSGVDLGSPAALQLQDFTIEAWINRQHYGGYIFAWGAGGYGLYADSSGDLYLNQVGSVNSSSGFSRLQDTSFFTSPDPNYYVNSLVEMWIVPNVLTAIPISMYNPALQTVYFPVKGISPASASKNGTTVTYYKILNNPANLDYPGEYSVMTNENRIYFYWTNLPVNIEVARRSGAIQVSSGGNMNIRGFKIISQCVGQPGFGNGVGIALWKGGSSFVTNVNILYNELMFCSDFTNPYPAIYVVCGQGPGAGANVISNTIHDCWNKGIIDGGNNTSVTGNLIYNMLGTGMDVSGANDTVSYNTLHDILGIHANGISTYGTTGGGPVSHLLLYGNLVYNMPRCYTFYMVTNIYVFNNVFDAMGQYNALVDWGLGSGTNYFINNVIMGDCNNISVEFMTIDTGDLKYVANNILGGMNGPIHSGPTNIYAAANLYVAANQWMIPRYHWSLGPGESINTKLAAIFVDAAHQNYHLAANSPAIGAGLDEAAFGITNDMAGALRTVPWDVGAYVFGPQRPAPPTGSRAAQ
jgi:Concanavalin A-like lectin/glucanases superfamily